MELQQISVGALGRHRERHRIVMGAPLRIRTCISSSGAAAREAVPLLGGHALGVEVSPRVPFRVLR